MAKGITQLSKKQIIFATGLTTFFFGFFAGALLNWYLIAVNDPLVTQFRSTLNYTSAIIGDGIVLPITNMIMVAFLLNHRKYLNKYTKYGGFAGGVIITAYFHITQAVQGIVNWAMPTPWHWNVLGFWHFFYMLAVSTLISGFYIAVFQYIKREGRVPKSAFLASFGIVIFLILLRLDYFTIKLF